MAPLPRPRGTTALNLSTAASSLSSLSSLKGIILPRRCTNRYGCGHIPPEKKPIVIVVGVIVGFIVVAVFLFSCFGDRGKKETNTTANAGDQQPPSATGVGAGAGVGAGMTTTATAADGFNDPQQGPPPPMYEETSPPPTYQRDGDGGDAGAPPPPRVRTGEMAPRYA